MCQGGPGTVKVFAVYYKMDRVAWGERSHQMRGAHGRLPQLGNVYYRRTALMDNQAIIPTAPFVISSEPVEG